MIPKDLPWKNISWKVMDQCNYRCTYCLQKEHGYNIDYPTNLVEILECINQNLHEKYEIKIAGGELFICPEKAFIIADKLSEKGHWLSVCTNLSAKIEDYYKFIDKTKGKLYTFGASLHLEYVDDVDEYLEKCIRIREYLPKYSKFQVYNVIPRDKTGIVELSKIKKKFDEKNLIFYTDLLVDNNGKYLEYTDEEQIHIKTYLGEDEKKICHKGKLCRAGNSYFVMTAELDVWCCWDGWYQKDEAMYLGNMKKGTFDQLEKCILCPYDTCSCPTPVFRHSFKIYE